MFYYTILAKEKKNTLRDRNKIKDSRSVFDSK